MKISLFIFTAAVLILSCSKPLPENKPKFTTDATHEINVQSKERFIPIRNRIMNKEELMISQKETEASKNLNEQTIIQQLENGTWIKLLRADTLGYHYVEVIDPNKVEGSETSIRGFIVSSFNQKPTIKVIEKISITPIDSSESALHDKREFLEFHSPNGNLMDYAYAYISPEADVIQVLTFKITGVNEIHYKIYRVELQEYQILFNGTAKLDNPIKNINGIWYSQYSAEKFIGHDLEINISEQNQTAILVFKDKFHEYISPSPDDVQMIRIK